ncbi:uncharacterized protein [Henckelia pumila]|uniref:uncharacterized protein n=1 Tax=Henckelia pumila TaxID=405737 RepID=UPI003C6E0E0C
MLFWKSQFDVHIKSFSSGHIDCIVSHSQFNWRFTGFYGHPNVSLRESSWELLKRLASLQEFSHFPWLVGGDFNEILFDYEKLGGSSKTSSQICRFRDTVNECNLSDLLCKGDVFTWCNRRSGDQNVCERLDRFLCTNSWTHLFPSAEVVNLEFFGSDHRPVFLTLCTDDAHILQKRSKRFFFEHKWYLEQDFTPFLKQCWQASSHLGDMPTILEVCKKDLQVWAGTRFNNLGKRISKLRKTLNHLQKSHVFGYNVPRILELEKEIEKLANLEEIHWKQRGRVNWLSNGQWKSDEDEMSVIVLNYFQSLFTSNHPTPSALSAALDLITPMVSSDMNAFLSLPFSAEEVYKAVFQIHPTKAPGLDGFTAIFFQKS